MYDFTVVTMRCTVIIQRRVLEFMEGRSIGKLHTIDIVDLSKRCIYSHNMSDLSDM